MNYTVAWKINTTGNSEGLPIPSGFTIACFIAVTQSVQNGVDFAQLEVQVATFKTEEMKDVIHINTDLVGQGFVAKGNVKTYTLVTSDLDKAVRTLVKNKIRPDLDNAYGTTNVVNL